MSFDYDVMVIGGGAAGMTAAKMARGFGKKVAIIEESFLGGECTWTGCIPSKTIIKSARVAALAKKLDQFGLAYKNEETSIDSTKLFNHVRYTIKTIYDSHAPQIFERMGIPVLKGRPAFIDNNYISLNQKVISSHTYILATGSLPHIPAIEGLSKIFYYTNQNFFTITRLPASLLIVGGGPNGIEMASALHDLGVAVTVVEIGSRILQRDDEELVTILMQHIQAKGVTLVTKSRAMRVEQKGRKVLLTCINDEKKEKNTYEADALLIATGREPNYGRMYLSNAGVTIQDNRLVVNNYLQTTAQNIYACGDVVGPYCFSHMAFHQAVVATRNALLPWFRTAMNYDNVAWVTFTDPELATCGLTEQKAIERYGEKNIRVYRKTFQELDRAITDAQEMGMAKIICDKRGYIVGAHILGPRAGELLNEIQVGKTYGLKLHRFYSVVHPYPTFSEIIWHMAKDAYVRRIQSSKLIKVAQMIMKWFAKRKR